MMEITVKNGKYHVSTNIEMDVDTNDFREVYEDYKVECDYEFANAVKKAFQQYTYLTEKIKNK